MTKQHFKIRNTIKDGQTDMYIKIVLHNVQNRGIDAVIKVQLMTKRKCMPPTLVHYKNNNPESYQAASLHLYLLVSVPSDVSYCTSENAILLFGGTFYRFCRLTLAGLQIFLGSTFTVTSSGFHHGGHYLEAIFQVFF